LLRLVAIFQPCGAADKTGVVAVAEAATGDHELEVIVVTVAVVHTTTALVLLWRHLGVLHGLAATFMVLSKGGYWREYYGRQDKAANQHGILLD
jgi:hypothetical protein